MAHVLIACLVQKSKIDTQKHICEEGKTETLHQIQVDRLFFFLYKSVIIRLFIRFFFQMLKIYVKVEENDKIKKHGYSHCLPF